MGLTEGGEAHLLFGIHSIIIIVVAGIVTITTSAALATATNASLRCRSRSSSSSNRSSTVLCRQEAIKTEMSTPQGP